MVLPKVSPSQQRQLKVSLGLKDAEMTGRSNQRRKNWVSPGQQKLPFAFDMRLNQIP
jgi:hypothetical protein